MRANRLTTGAALALALIGAMALGGCSGRDTEMSEKFAAVDAAVLRAEAAATRAEAAASAADKSAAEQPDEPEAAPEDEAPNEPAAE